MGVVYGGIADEGHADEAANIKNMESWPSQSTLSRCGFHLRDTVRAPYESDETSRFWVTCIGN